MQTPEPDVRRRVDACISLSDHIVQRAIRHVTVYPEQEEAEPWPDLESVLDCTSSLSKSHKSKYSSVSSSILSVKRNEAVVEAAAAQEVLAVLDEQDKEATELQRLETEDKQRLAQFESEKLAKQQAIQERHGKIDRLEDIKKLNAAKARVKVYDQAENCGSLQRLNDVESAVEFQVPDTKGPPFIPQSQPVITNPSCFKPSICSPVSTKHKSSP